MDNPDEVRAPQEDAAITIHLPGAPVTAAPADRSAAPRLSPDDLINLGLLVLVVVAAIRAGQGWPIHAATAVAGCGLLYDLSGVLLARRRPAAAGVRWLSAGPLTVVLGWQLWQLRPLGGAELIVAAAAVGWQLRRRSRDPGSDRGWWAAAAVLGIGGIGLSVAGRWVDLQVPTADLTNWLLAQVVPAVVLGLVLIGWVVVPAIRFSLVSAGRPDARPAVVAAGLTATALLGHQGELGWTGLPLVVLAAALAPAPWPRREALPTSTMPVAALAALVLALVAAMRLAEEPGFDNSGWIVSCALALLALLAAVTAAGRSGPIALAAAAVVAALTCWRLVTGPIGDPMSFTLALCATITTIASATQLLPRTHPAPGGSDDALR